ncbi:MAG: Extracellular solute-binding protein family 1 [Candidatus Peregrinibacteria bacterium GW2011_GWE2_39_6]|nr:MAG: Extracellular solute-binding protein family 1 [Candidatus Peregrinibacteria bacterium GW2011_GWF2_39_17]KKR23413.1 MAG: Extracellular solute-binding protein family 1 [Candidatus Peregrinibacteria bacterium GW2011_GWE2_39_6]HCW32840.1 hypothetical protein [Candidatus Peregrinibacteria bacterium]
MKIMRRNIAFILLGCLIFLFSGCGEKDSPAQDNLLPEKIELTYYRLFDGEDVFAPLIREYESQHKNVVINYKKFTNPDQYLNLIINELAEGEGPDMFSMNNTWFIQHRKKLAPVPEDLISADDFKNTFVKVAASDLILPDIDGKMRIYGLPMYIDTLALYYNVDHFEDAIPSRGKPASTWADLQEDVYKLTKPDNSFERFEVSGVAMGRADNILRAIDLFYLLMIQFGTNFYDPSYSHAIFADSQGADITGIKNPGLEVLQFFTSFALPSNKYYTWNFTLADANSDDKEIKTFAKGKVSMIFGYSYLYQQIMDKIKELDKTGVKTINANSVKIAPIPQVEDPKVSTDKRDAFASYFAETVSRTSKHPDEAWKFLSFLVSKGNLQYYHEQTHRPTSRRDMIQEQSEDSVYGVFADQIGFAESLPVADAKGYEEVFIKAITDVLGTKDVKTVLKAAQDEIESFIPEGGLFPAVITIENTN